MEIDNSILLDLSQLTFLFLIIYFLLYYKFVYSIIDPLFVFVILTAFTSVLATQVIQDSTHLIHFFLCQLFLWFGFFIAHSSFRKRSRKESNQHEVLLPNFSEETILVYTTYALIIVYVISNLFIASTKGFALFSEAPSEAKVTNYQGGYGIFRKVNWGVGGFVVASLFFLYLRTRRSLYIFLLLTVALFASIDGSKSALLGVVVSGGFIFYHPVFKSQTILIKKFQRFLPIAIPGVMLVFFIVLIKEKGSFNGAFIGFFQRLFYSGDSLLYYYLPVNQDYFESYTPFDYFSRITNPVLGFLRLQPYHEALGNIMVENTQISGYMGGVTVGPNTPFYVEGEIYFGYWGALPYCTLLGYITAIIRIYYFSIVKTSAFYFVLFATFCQMTTALVTDVNMTVDFIFDLLFFVSPVYIIVSLIVKQKIVFKPASFINRSTISLK